MESVTIVGYNGGDVDMVLSCTERRGYMIQITGMRNFGCGLVDGGENYGGLMATIIDHIRYPATRRT